MHGCKLLSSISRDLSFCVALLWWCAGNAQAAPIPHGTVELVAENQWIATGHTLNLGLYFQLEKGWHIYWVNPGDSGEPPQVKWQLPPGLTTEAIEWPTPHRLGTTSIVDYGYEDAVMLIVPIRSEVGLSAEESTRLSAEVKVLVCREMCIPGKAQLSVTLPMKSQHPAPDARVTNLFATTRKALPRPVPTSWKFHVVVANDFLVLTANLAHRISQANFFPLVESQIDNAAPQNFQPETTGFRLTLRKSNQLPKPIERLKGILVVTPEEAYMIDVPLSKSDAGTTGSGFEIQSAHSL